MALQAARSRARDKGLVCSLTADDVQKLIAEATNCPACAAVLETKTRHAPSLDRINNNDGYVLGNVAVLCRRCNLRKGDMTAAELFQLAEYTAATSG